MNAQYNWINIMNHHLFDFVSDVRRENPVCELIEYWFNSDSDLTANARERWIVLNQMDETYTVKQLIEYLEETFDEHTGVLLSNMESESEEEEDSEEEEEDDSNDVLPKDCIDGWIGDPDADAEPTECPICYDVNSCYSPLDWNSNARCCHKLCGVCIYKLAQSNNHNCPQCRRNISQWLMIGRTPKN